MERHREVAPLAEEWDALADRVAAVPWVRPGWIDAWWRAFGSGSLDVVAIRRDGALVAVLPLVQRSGALASPTNWHTPGFAVVAADEDAAREAVAAALALRPSRLDLSFLACGSARAPADEARSRGYHVHSRLLMRSPYVEIEGDWETFARSHARKRLKDLGRVRRKLEADGPLELEVADGSARLDALLEEGFAVEHSGWKLENGTAIVSRPETRRFYEDVARWSAERGWLRLFFLRSCGRAIAFEYTLASGGSIYDVKGGIDPAYRKVSPGVQTLARMLEHAFANGYRTFELLGTEEPYKLEWSTGVREHVRLQAYAPTLAGTVQRVAFVHGRPLAKRVLAFARRHAA